MTVAFLISAYLRLHPPAPSPREMAAMAVSQLIDMQEEEGQWPYEGVYRVGGDIPIGYRVGGTAIVASALLQAADPQDERAARAIEKGLDFVLKGLDHSLMTFSAEDAYDVRVWGQAYALEFLCLLRMTKRDSGGRNDIDAWIPRLVESLVREEIPGGGWNYAGRRSQATFVTAPVVQALLLARSQGARVPDDVLARAGDALLNSRTTDGAFMYQRRATAVDSKDVRAQLPGSIARSAVCETTLLLLGKGSTEGIQGALDAFHRHWDELEKRRKKTGTHKGPYGVAPYYFYYGHRYAAQAIEMLPPQQRPQQRQRLLEVILRTRDPDGTWNDRVFPRSRNYGTAMVVLALLGDKAILPPALPRTAEAPASP